MTNSKKLVAPTLARIFRRPDVQIAPTPEKVKVMTWRRISSNWGRSGEISALGLAAVIAALARADSLPYPETPKTPVAETYHGVTVVDPYRWLENDAASDVKQWTAAQNALTRIDRLRTKNTSARAAAHLPVRT